MGLLTPSPLPHYPRSSATAGGRYLFALKEEARMTLVNGAVVALLADLEKATTEIINQHWDRDKNSSEPVLRNHGSFEVRVFTDDGLLARFMEEGIDIYPDVTA
jgi:hypothetical protein